jgi:hypothetical protein
MISVNSVNACTFCSGLHCELGRIAGVQNPLGLNAARRLDEVVGYATDAVSRAAVTYARIFAITDGRGKKAAEAFGTLVAECGEGQAKSVSAACWFLYWGSFVGNTLNGAMKYKKPKPGTSERFLVQFLFYYGALFFGLISFVSAITKALPRLPRLLSALVGVVLALVGGSFFTPLGMVGKLVGATRTTAGSAKVVRSPLKLATDVVLFAVFATGCYLASGYFFFGRVDVAGLGRRMLNISSTLAKYDRGEL